MKRCIFHYLQPIEEKPGIGSALRPNRMLQAFRAIGYEVFVIAGYSDERQEKIREVRNQIRSGIQYDFVYAESINGPAALSDRDHIPRHPFLDFSFFRFCRKMGIPVGLFYRDIHWKFPVYRENVALWKRMISLPLLRHDLRMYRKTVDILFVPSAQMGAIVPHSSIVPLPPGGQFRPDVLEKRTLRSNHGKPLQIFYVGNVLGVYDVTAFVKAVKETEGVEFTLCTPRESWEAAKHKYEPYLCNRIRVVHESGKALQPYYEEADLFCCCLKATEYTRLAMPIKVFESISYGVPVMITEGIAAEALITETDCGWVVENNADAYRELLRHLVNSPEEIRQKTEKTLAAASKNTWDIRAQKAAEDLIALQIKE